MRWIGIVLAIMVISAVAVNGHNNRPKATGNEDSVKNSKKPEQPLPTEIPPSIVINQETPNPQNDGSENPSKSYLSHLFSAENLPNIGLLVAGIIGIRVAIRTLNHMRESAERQLRAYVIVEIGSIVNIADPIPTPGLEPTDARRKFPWGPVARVQIKNTGQTPAFKVEHWGNLHFTEFPLTSELPPRAEGLEKSLSIIGPGIINTKTLSIGPALTDEEIARLRVPTAAIYFYGEITYEDAFGKRHITRYRLLHNQRSGPVGITTDFTFAAQGNEAD